MHDNSIVFERISGKYKKNKVIKNLEKIKLSKNDYIFHAGTKIEKIN